MRFLLADDFVDDWDVFLAPYQQAVEELKLKLKNIRKEYHALNRHAPIEFVTGRTKTKESILEKMHVRNIAAEDMLDGVQDIAGIRIMCQFVEDIYEVANLMMNRKDFKVILIRDYIQHRKPSGYRSYHIHAYYHLETIDGMKKVMIEFQIRTLAMNFWASIEHSLNYKYEGQIPKGIKNRLKQAAEAAAWLDGQMSEIRDEIAEAQKTFEKRQTDEFRVVEPPANLVTLNEDYLFKKHKGE